MSTQGKARARSGFVVGAAALGLLLATVAPTSAEAAAPAGATTAAAAATTKATTKTTGKPSPLLPKPMHGRAAVTALGDKLPEAARRNGTTPAALRDLLVRDSTMWLDQAGRLFVADVMADPTEPVMAGQSAAATSGPSSAAAGFSPVAPLGDTFSLHSSTTPGATTIFLDFDGVTLGDSAWGWTQKNYGGYDTDGDPSTFSAAERVAIQQIWAQVAEDYAPFRVDVTTQDPGPLALTRSSLGDTSYGMRVAITDDPSSRAQVEGCETGCNVVGLAFVDVFDQVPPSPAPEYSGPAWVFAFGVGNDPRLIAEIATHEVGHTFGLQHTSVPATSAWASIMNPIIPSVPVTQWSNTDGVDQEFVIAFGGAPFVADEPGTSQASARSYTAGAGGVISTPSDTDWFVLFDCRAGATVTAQPADVAPNLDIQASLVDSTGVTVASNAPATTASGAGMNATLTIPTDGFLAPWFVMIDGVGTGPNGAAEGGANGYGSLGRYVLDVVGCGVAGSTPSAPRNVVATTVTTPSATTANVTWSAPSFTGTVGAAALTYAVSIDDGPWTSVGNTLSASLSTTPGRHLVAVRAVNVVGSGPAATVVSVIAPSTPTRVWLEPSNSFFPGASLIIWTGVDDGGDPPTDGRVWTSETGTGSVTPLFDGRSGGTIATLTEGTMYWMSLTNRAGTSPRFPFVAHRTPVLSDPVDDAAVSADKFTQKASLSWAKPVDDGGGASYGYQVALDDGPWVDVSTTSYVFTGVSVGDHVAHVRAVNVVGEGPEAQVPFTMPAVDTTGPVLTPTVTGTLGSNGWYVSDVSVSWTVEDPESGVASQTGCAAVTLTTDSAGTTYGCAATNGDGYSSSTSVTVKRDATAPTLAPAVSKNPAVQGETITVSANGSDALSGIDPAATTCGAPSTATVGVVSVSCSVTDRAGNTASASASYTVVNAFLGFQSPLPKSSLLKSSSTIPVKFTVGNLAGTSRSTTADVQVRFSTAPNGGGTVLATQACTYSATLLAYQCNLKTPSGVKTGTKPPTPYYLTVFQRVPNGTGTWYLMPNGTGVVNTNSEAVSFK